MHINIKRLWSAFLVLCLICALVPVSPVNAADDDQVKASISVTPTSIYEDEVVNVDITLEGIPYEGKVMPNDVILVIDRSGSMSSYLSDMITAAKDFVDLVDLTTHRIGIVDYESTVSSYEITTNKDKLKEYIDTLTSTGTTRIDLAVDKAVELLAGKRSSAEGSIVLMTDGEADDLALALQAAERAKANGYSFYTVALTSSQTSAANQNLMKMATSEADHYFVWPSSGLPDVYQKISEKIGYANAKNVVVSQVISDQFELVAGSTDSNIPQPYINGQKLRWDMNQLGKGIVHLTYQLKVKGNTVPGIYNHVSSGSVVYTSYTGGSKSIVLDKVAITVNKHSPEIISINQTDFDIAGGEQVVITGNYINDSAIVNLGSTAISNAVISNNQITFTMPAHVVGTDTITVTNPDGQVSAPLAVNFISSTPIPPMTVTPDSGLEYKSAKVTVTGITLTAKKATQLTVTVGGTVVKVVSYDTKNKNSLAFYVPNSFGAGDVDIVITDRDGTQYTGQYTYLPKDVPDMTISSVTPASSVEYENQKVTIAGTNFASSSKMTVTVGGTEVKLVSCSDTELSFYVPNTFAAGIYDIIITNSKLNKTATVQYEFTTEVNNTPLTVIGITPSSGEELTNQKVTVTGQNFASSSKMHVTIGGTEVKLVSCSDTELSFYVPNTFVAGVYDVVITRTDTQETQSTQYECTTVVNNTPLTVTGISPSSGEELTNQKVTVTGQNFASSSKMHVTIGGTEVKLVSCSDTELSFYVPNTFVAGVYDVVIMRTDTQEIQTIQYECTTVVNNTPLTVTGISPSSGEELTNQKVTVTGQNFASSSKMHVTIGGTEVKLVSCSDTELSF
ncbi:MAG: IPT/TIG domain-containing protein, partial [Lachnospiraceae bacterium]|nr:IPT/TIG domain-containing protein [Lachnospiraceae bacterium]